MTINKGNMEHNEGLDHLAKDLNKLPFKVPEGYFQQLKSNICTCVHIAPEAEKGLTIPPDYFQHLEQSVLARLAEEKLRSQVSSTGFEVPSAYFESLQAKILKGSNKRENKIPDIPIKKISSFQQIKYVAAACVMLAIGFYTYTTLEATTSYQEMVHSATDEEILSYLEYFDDQDDAAFLFNQVLSEGITLDQTYLPAEDIQAYLNEVL